MITSIEQSINYQLNKYPKVKKIIKRIYQRIMYGLSHKIKSEGNIRRISPNDDKEYFFGYYDKSPWDATGRYVLCMRANNTWSNPDPTDVADIIIIDTQSNNSVRKIASTRTWNVQQGCMAQWLGPDFINRIIYNDLIDGKYCSIILNVQSGNVEKVIKAPVYTVSPNGKTALSLDFSRLHNLRKGYGYAAIPESTAGVAIPDSTAIWKIDLESGSIIPLLTYKDFADFETRPEMIGAVHKVNHLMISPSGKRFMVLHRWFKGDRKFTRLITCNIDGSDMYNLSDDDMVSHCFWKNDEEILAYENKRTGGPGYYLMKDKTNEYKSLWPELSFDGHPSYCPTSNLIVTDCYPDRSRVAKVFVTSEDRNPEVKAKVFAPFKYDNDTRCDLHPRWKRDGTEICFDSVFEGHRGLYSIKI